jgi:hypothetical protein
MRLTASAKQTSVSCGASKDNPGDSDGPGQPAEASVGRVCPFVEAGLVQAGQVDLPMFL